MFVKQLGSRPFYRGLPIRLKDAHGGEMREWREHPELKDLGLDIREFPREFHEYRPIRKPFTEKRPVGA